MDLPWNNYWRRTIRTIYLAVNYARIGQADLISVVGTSWHVRTASHGYTQRIKPCGLGIHGLPAAGDLDGDGFADLIVIVGSDWYLRFPLWDTPSCLVRIR